MPVRPCARIIVTGKSQSIVPLLEQGGVPYLTPLDYMVNTFQAAGITAITLITTTGAAEYAQKALANRGVDFLVVDAVHPDGKPDPLALIQTALKHLQPSQEVLIAPEDTPFFSAETLRTLMAQPKRPCMPVYNERGGHPILLNADICEQVLTINCEGGLRQALSQLGIERHGIPVPDPGCIRKITADLSAQKVLIKQLQPLHIQPAIKIMLKKSELFFGPGAAQLLRLIDETGSVRKASQRMNISYSKAWGILRTVDAQIGAAAVDRQQGGRTGGSAALTPAGQALLRRYEAFEREAEHAVQRTFNEHFGDFTAELSELSKN